MWQTDHTTRRVSFERSKDQLPCHLMLVRADDDAVVGHSLVTKDTISGTCLVESGEKMISICLAEVQARS